MAWAFPASLPYTDFENGVLAQIGSQQLTGTDSNGCEWYLFSPLTGWDTSPASSRQSTQKTRGAGSWAGPRNSTSRSIVLTGRVVAPTPDKLQTAIDGLNAAVSLQDTLLSISRGSRTLSSVVARQDEVLWTDVTDVIADWSVQVGADDPRKYATALTGSTALPSSSGGLTVPFKLSFAINSTFVSGRLSLTNPGNTTGLVAITFTGPLTGPSVTHVGPSGLVSTISMSPSYALASSAATLIIDPTPDGQSVLEQGQQTRANYLTSRGWHWFEPGVNTWSFAAATGSGSMTVTATPAWI